MGIANISSILLVCKEVLILYIKTKLHLLQYTSIEDAQSKGIPIPDNLEQEHFIHDIETDYLFFYYTDDYIDKIKLLRAKNKRGKKR